MPGSKADKRGTPPHESKMGRAERDLVALGIAVAAILLFVGTGGLVLPQVVRSWTGVGAAPNLGPYGVAKSGVIQLTQTGAVEVAKAGIRINAVCPGWTDTAIIDNLGPEGRTRVLKGIPLGRLGRPAEIANLIAFLASDEASFITGVAYRIDGGIKS